MTLLLRLVSVVLPDRRQWPVYPTYATPRLLMAWRHRGPGHQQQSYWPNFPRIFRPQHWMGLSLSENCINKLRPRENGRHFAHDIFKCIFLNENVWIPIKISLKFVPKGPINNIPALVQIMAWCRPGHKPLSEPMMVSLLTHICVTRSQWVNKLFQHYACWRLGSFMLPVHQWYRLYEMEMFLSLFWVNFNNLWQFSVEQWYKMKCISMFLARKLIT